MKNALKKMGLILLTILCFSLYFTSFAYAWEKSDTGFIYTENLPKYADEEFLKAPVRMEIFVTDWCKHCIHLKDSMIDAIYNEFTPDEVAIRLLDKDNPVVLAYMKNIQGKFDMEGREELKERIPTIIINSQYMVVGYGGEEMNKAMIDSIRQLMEGKEITIMKTFSLKGEYRTENNSTIFQYEKYNAEDAKPDHENMAPKPEGEEKAEEGNYQDKTAEGTGKEEKNWFYPAEEVTFFLVQGLYDSLNFLVYAYVLAVLLFFVPYKKFKIVLSAGSYILGLVAANCLARYSDTGLATFRQPILIVTCLLFATLSLSVFWDLYFTALSKNRRLVQHKRNKILVWLKKLLNKNWAVIPLFMFGFALYFFTTPYDVDYGLVLHRYENTVLFGKIALLALNGFCASLASVLGAFIISTCKKMNHEVLEPSKRYGFYYVAAGFYLILFFLLIHFIFKIY